MLVGIIGLLLGSNVFRKKKKRKIIILKPIAAFLKTQLQEKPMSGSIVAFFTKRSYRSHLIGGWENATIGCKNAAIWGHLAAFIKTWL